jgi:hypothetical protein
MQEYARLTEKLIQRLTDEGRCFSEGHKLLEEVFEEEKQELREKIAGLQSQLVGMERKLKAEQKGHRKSVQKRDREIEKLKEELSSTPEPPLPSSPQPKEDKPKDLRAVTDMTFPDLVSFVFYNLANGKPIGLHPNAKITIKCAPVFLEGFTSNTAIHRNDLSRIEKSLVDYLISLDEVRRPESTP